MIICQKISELRNKLKPWQNHPDQTIGFVPTMGFLHEGHSSLIKTARQENNCVVVSIFVNPTQFGPGEDFETYPRDTNADLSICKDLEVDIVFMPDTTTMYPLNPLTKVTVTDLTDCLCGKYRPGHFDGVTTVVAKLFNAVQPDRAYFGQKDAQQVLVIKRMVNELLFPLEIRIGPTIREEDGLAMSSRNVRLTTKGRKIAPIIYQSLKQAHALVLNGENRVHQILESCRKNIEQHPEMDLQYLECRDRQNLEPLNILYKPALLATAIYIDGVRLIDNIFLDPPEDTTNDQS